ncbi:pentapeptide repeat-containing protein [Metabacillus sp. 84]|uniref:pentapeptide repeat-containing protein n=1 Tax=Metabacillus sp. 84 TaxID=3404705 RepID=UPI003CEAC1F6
MEKIEQSELDSLINDHNKYIDSVQRNELEGNRLILDGIDFSNNNLSELNFLDVYITDSFFKNHVFENTNFGGAKLYGCKLNHIVFRKANLGKAEMNYSHVADCAFEKSDLIKVNSFETYFENVNFTSCIIDDFFSNSKINQVQFEDCKFGGVEFWECVTNNIKFKNHPFNANDHIKRINKGTLEQPIFVDGNEAIKVFIESCNGCIET